MLGDRVGCEHSLEVVRKCRGFFFVIFGSAPVRLSDGVYGCLTTFKSLCSLPEGVVTRGEGGKVMFKGGIVGVL